MRVALYARVSSLHQTHTQTIEQQLTRLRSHVQQQGWTLDESHSFRDEGYSGASLSRPGLDALRDHAAHAEIDQVLISAPDRLARRYVHQVLLIEELEQHGCHVEFLERPMSSDPNDQLLLQIRGAVAEYERSLITERMRRGKLAKLRTGQVLPWTRRPYGYQVDADHPRDPGGVHLDAYEAGIIQQIFAWYLAQDANLYSVAEHLAHAQVPSPRGRPRWTTGSIRAVLTNPTYTGTAYGNRYRMVPVRQRKSALLPVGPGKSHRLKPQSEWVAIPVPAIVSQEDYDLVKEKLAHNQQSARRHNTTHHYLLRGLVSCGRCRLTVTARTTPEDHPYYACRGRNDKLRIAEGRACDARYIPAQQLDALIWQDLCTVLTEPEPIAEAFQRAQNGQWLPQEVQARHATLRQGLVAIERQQARLLEAYLAEVVELAEFERKRQELTRRTDSLNIQLRQLEALVQQRIDYGQFAASLEEFCAQVRTGLKQATFEQKRTLVTLLIDCIVVTDAEVEIRYVVPAARAGPHQPFCHLRLDYRTR